MSSSSPRRPPPGAAPSARSSPTGPRQAWALPTRSSSSGRSASPRPPSPSSVRPFPSIRRQGNRLMRAPRVSPPVAAEAPQGPTLPLSTLTVGYGGAALLKRMLDSLLASKPPPAEVILVDNASPEPLGEVFGAFAAAAREAGIRPHPFYSDATHR